MTGGMEFFQNIYNHLVIFVTVFLSPLINVIMSTIDDSAQVATVSRYQINLNYLYYLVIIHDRYTI